MAYIFLGMKMDNQKCLEIIKMVKNMDNGTIGTQMEMKSYLDKSICLYH